MSCEPAFLQNAPLVIADWAALIGAVESLILRVSSLESLLEGRSQHLRSAFFRKYFGMDLMPNFRQVKISHHRNAVFLREVCSSEGQHLC